MFFNDLINSKNDKIKLSVKSRTNEEYMSVKYGCIQFLESMRFQPGSMEFLTESSKDEDWIHLKEEFPNHWGILKKKLAHPYEFHKNLEGYEEPIERLLKS